MESYEESNCFSLSDSFSLYERYMKSFNVVNNYTNDRIERAPSDFDNENSNSGGNIDLSEARESNVCEKSRSEFDKTPSLQQIDNIDKGLDDVIKIGSPCTSTNASSCLTDNLNDKSDLTDVPVSSEESKSHDFKPAFITSTMENSNNAVDSVPMFRDAKATENVFKLPITELSFNATILKHVQKLKPIVDPITALTTANNMLSLTENSASDPGNNGEQVNNLDEPSGYEDRSNSESTKLDKSSETGDSQSQSLESRKLQANEGSSKWNLDQSYSSLEGSFDSGVRSPDMFSDGEEEALNPEPEPFWSFLKDYETNHKIQVRKIEERLHGVLPPPSVTILKTDVTQMLKKYYTYLPFFNGEEHVDVESNSMTPKKKVSFVKIPETSDHCDDDHFEAVIRRVSIDSQALNTSTDKSVEIKMATEAEALQTEWPDVLKCKYYDVYYNLTSYSEKLERLNQKYAERFVGAETDTSVNIYSGGLQSPSSASKRKALRIKMAQVKSPGRRLSHLARRRQAFCSAATISEKAQCSTSKMVLIDKKKLISSAERKSPRTRRTPGKKTPTSKTPGKKTPGKTPKSGSSKKKAMRRLLLDNESLTRSQPARETLKRALFISPENRKSVPAASSSSVPHQAMRSKRALFGSPVKPEETKSSDGTISDRFHMDLKRKRNPFDEGPENRSKIAKSLSFGGDSITSSQPSSIPLNRRASEMPASRNMAELNETHKKKLLWAVTEALRLHGWKMSSPGFKEKASLLARLTRRLLTLPPHAAKLAAPKLSTSDTLFKLARQYVFAIIQGRTVEECFQDEQIKLSNDSTKLTGYISASAYQQLKNRQIPATLTSQVKENTCSNGSAKPDPPRSSTKNILQDKLVNIDTNSNSSSGFSNIERPELFKSNSMPSFEEAAKMRARRQITFDNLDFPKR
ncbi:uncharacterized protein LOC121737125 isoform X2 [Aricia agestis]|uniref:uncharacterized protein LOC121737125 isoform X2 n=1 Tax=Aricia agestis TaxID=91739 RepID=UPI001C207B3F|nr:uncharacterized protein LOC121737125 isoform X2 [Aricia agestis]